MRLRENGVKVLYLDVRISDFCSCSSLQYGFSHSRAPHVLRVSLLDFFFSLCFYYWGKAGLWAPEGFNDGEMKGSEVQLYRGSSVLPLAGAGFLPEALRPTARMVSAEA